MGDGVCGSEMELGILPQELGTFLGVLMPLGRCCSPTAVWALFHGGSSSTEDPTPTPRLVNEDLVKGIRRSPLTPMQCQQGLHLGWDISTTPNPAFWGL